MQKNLIREPKRSAIVCTGVRISMDAANVRTVDMYQSRQYLMNVLGRTEVDFVCRKLDKEADVPFYKNITEVDLNDYDEVFIYNSTNNLFGGIFFQHSYDTFKALYDYKGELYYMLFDPKMPPVDYGQFVKSRIKDGKIKTDKQGEVSIDPGYCDEWSERVFKRMKIAFSGKDYDKYYREYCGALKKKSPLKDLNPDYEWTNFWIFEYYAKNEEWELKNEDYPLDHKNYDLVYFGNVRNTERTKLVKKLYSDKNMKKLFLGIDPEMENSETYKYVAHAEMFFKVTQAWATVVVGDPLHNGNFKTARLFEALSLDIVGFIYDEYDPKHEYIKDEFLKGFIYVKDGKELSEKVEMLKSDPELYRKVVSLERAEVERIYNEIV